MNALFDFSSNELIRLIKINKGANTRLGIGLWSLSTLRSSHQLGLKEPNADLWVLDGH